MVAVLGLALALAAQIAHAAPGDLDPSFDRDGRWIRDFGAADSARAVLVQPDGKLVVAGLGTPDDAITVTRLNRDGSLDNSFSGDGTVAIGILGPDQGYAAALQPDGKIVVAGRTGTSPRDAAVVRLNPDGSLDTGFHGDGMATINYGGDDSANAVVVLPGGRIVVAGSGGLDADTAVTVALLDQNGLPDPSFGGGSGQVTLDLDLDGDDAAYGVAFQPAAGGILVAGSAFSPQRDAFVLRLNLDGTLDATFRETGVSFLGGEGSDEARALILQPDGKIVVAGDGNPSTDVTVWRLDSNGQLDPTFGANRPVEVDFGEFDYGYASALQANGKIVVAGYTTVGGNLLGDFVIVRLQPGGSLDTTFSVDGKQTVNFGGDDAAYAVALQPDGKIVAAGEAAGDVAVARLQGEPGPGGGPAGGDPAGGVPGGPRRPSSSVPRCASRAATIVGTARRDVLRGTRRADVVAALGGDDRIRASAGNDLVCTGAGDDSASGGPGADRLLGQRGSDKLRGGLGKDRLRGGRGRDRCSGGPGADLVACERPRG